jgi:hypothetical protein
VASARIQFLETCYRELGLALPQAKAKAVFAYAAYRGLLQLAHEAPPDLVLAQSGDLPTSGPQQLPTGGQCIPRAGWLAFCKLRLDCGQLGSSRDLAHPYFSIGGRSSVTTVSLPVNRLPASRSPDRFGETQERRFRAFFQIGEVPKADTHQTESLCLGLAATLPRRASRRRVRQLRHALEDAIGNGG